MKHRIVTVLIACILLCMQRTAAQVKQKLTLKAVTIYLSGASLTSTASLNLQKGEQEILLTNVAVNVNTASLIINATNGVVIESSSFQSSVTVSDGMNRRVKEMHDSIDLLTESRSPRYP